MEKRIVEVLAWDEISMVHCLYLDACDARIVNEDDEGELALEINADDATIEAFLRRLWHDDEDEPGWTVAKISRGEATITVEWRSDRNHLAVNTLMFGPYA